MIALVSVSGGKDSTATLLLALDQLPRISVYPVFADTGNEDESVYHYLTYLQYRIGVKIKRLRADFTERWWRRRDYVRDHWAEKGVPADVIARALSVLEAGPTGNQFLDLCVIKGRFPSRMAQFCTQELKRFPIEAYTAEIMRLDPVVESWQGVRRDESPARAKLAARERVPEGFTIVRPILDWTVADVFAYAAKRGVEPNPLYRQGMTRVGCMPCINVRKDELLEISRRKPGHIARIAMWESLVGQASKRGASSFFVEQEGSAPLGIYDKVEWAKTERGGTQYDLLRSAPGPDGCASSYGLCDTGSD